MIKSPEEGLKRYKKALRLYKKAADRIRKLLPPEAHEIYLPPKEHRAITEYPIMLQGMAKALGLTKREIRKILKEVGLEEAP